MAAANEQLRDAKHRFLQANKAYTAAMDLAARAAASKTAADATADQALAARIAAEQNLEVAFQAYKDDAADDAEPK